MAWAWVPVELLLSATNEPERECGLTMMRMMMMMMMMIMIMMIMIIMMIVMIIIDRVVLAAHVLPHT